PDIFSLSLHDALPIYDPDHLRIYNDIKNKIGAPLYGRAILEEPLEVSTSTFKWAEQSDPFSYVGPHWTDLFYHYYGAKPIGLTADRKSTRLNSSHVKI